MIRKLIKIKKKRHGSQKRQDSGSQDPLDANVESTEVGPSRVGVKFA